MYKVEYKRHILDFNFPARTSRGAIQQKETYFIRIFRPENPTITGIGECSPLRGLSIDDRPDYEDFLRECTRQLSQMEDLKRFRSIPGLEEYPSIAFGIEMAVYDYLNGGTRDFFGNDFRKGTQRIPINGLVWMGDRDFMLEQVKTKLKAGFDCIKIKVGAINFEEECELIEYIRSNYTPEEITIRVDANGAFTAADALEKLQRLASYQLHSIEQPIKAGQIEVMRELCQQTPLPIALDEELIGIKSSEKASLLDRISPQYIILKPSLLGGFQQSEEWINLAEERGIGWWMTSALEANVGLNAISQFTAQYPVTMPQGLGTGQLYHNNIDSPLTIEKGELYYDTTKAWGSLG
ncbi:o-succinylbenzoate synthase [Algivirga pacifica]|uniref:O-succinylbenzoate synthase n=1 Tax=Algivirga pacifica TaxID=1162670 RepID=A0ABP9DSE4_9BACT